MAEASEKRGRESLQEAEESASKKIKIEEERIVEPETAIPVSTGEAVKTEVLKEEGHNPTSSTEAVVVEAAIGGPQADGAAAHKRERESADVVESAPEKKARVEGREDDEAQNGTFEGTEPVQTGVTGADDALGEDKPVKIGFKTFDDGKSARDYYSRLLANLTLNQRINEYERLMVVDLVKKGHPDPLRKIGTGIQGVQVEKMHYENNTATNVFILYRNDATSDDFSVRKCVANLFPKYAATLDSEPKHQKKKGRGRGGGTRGGRGRRGRGRA